MRKILLTLALIVIAICVVHSKNVSKTQKGSLYERLGGIYSIAAVVDHFSDSLINNPVVGVNSENPFLREWNRKKLDRLPGLKWMRTLWLAALAGGPYKYVPTKPGIEGETRGLCPRVSFCPFSLEKAHEALHITSEEFDAVAEELRKSLTYFHVGNEEINEVLKVFASHKHEVVSH